MITFVLSSCHESVRNLNKDITLDLFSDLRNDVYSFNPDKIRDNIDKIVKRENASFTTDRYVKAYYEKRSPFIWVSRMGVHEGVDTLVALLKDVESHGLSMRAFRLEQIEQDLNVVKNIDNFQQADNINLIAARLEYNLTRAYMRYSAGLYYGFVNPDYLYNNLEQVDVDSVRTRFIQLSDLRAKRPDDTFYSTAMHKVAVDSVAEFLEEMTPDGKLYGKLKQMLADVTDKDKRLKLVGNMERLRWRPKVAGQWDEHNKYVVVNIPSYSLRAVDHEQVLTMRVGCGTSDHKTPLLTSQITRLDVNPQWIVPKSIAKGYVYNHDYMRRMGMFVHDKKKGKLPPEAASYEKVMNGEQYIIQAGGPKNSLGRLIFRFENNFSVFLHDTSSPWLLQRDNRAISHGCVRVEKPLDLALFMLDGKDGDTETKLRYSVTIDPSADNDSITKSKIDRKLLVNTLSVKPSVPVYIVYLTVYYDDKNRLVYFDDVYGYDEALIEKMTPFIN